MASVTEKKSSWTVYHLWGWILLVWSLYRRFLKLPEWADEFIFKPLVFVAPVLWYVRTIEKRKLESIGRHFQLLRVAAPPCGHRDFLSRNLMQTS